MGGWSTVNLVFFYGPNLFPQKLMLGIGPSRTQSFGPIWPEIGNTRGIYPIRYDKICFIQLCKEYILPAEDHIVLGWMVKC